MKATDMYNGNVITYPASGVKLKYDFHFRKDGNWYYCSSSDDAGKLIDILTPPVIAKGELWRVVEAVSGNIVRTNVS